MHCGAPMIYFEKRVSITQSCCFNNENRRMLAGLARHNFSANTGEKACMHTPPSHTSRRSLASASNRFVSRACTARASPSAESRRAFALCSAAESGAPNDTRSSTPIQERRRRRRRRRRMGQRCNVMHEQNESNTEIAIFRKSRRTNESSFCGHGAFAALAASSRWWQLGTENSVGIAQLDA
jgi:hypothetical protein